MSDSDDKDLDQLYRVHLYSQTQFDKNLLYIASGALGISFAFIEKLVPLEGAKCSWLIITGWAILSTTVLLSLIAHYISTQNISYLIKHHNLDYDDYENKRVTRNKPIKVLNLIMMLSIFLGIVFIVTFVSKNI